LIALTAWSFTKTPTGFVPTQDKQYLVAFAQLPDAASLDRTEAVIRRMSDLALEHPGVKVAMAFPALSINGLTRQPVRGRHLCRTEVLQGTPRPGAGRARHRRRPQP